MSDKNPTYDQLLSENKQLKTLLLNNNQSEETRLQSEFEFTSTKKLIDEANLLKKLAIDGAKAGTLLLDLVKDELIWDKRSFEIYGIDEESFGGNFEAWAKLVHEDDLKRILPEVDKQLKSGVIIDFRYRIIRPDGEVRHLWANASIIRDEQGDAILLSGLHFDETELVNAKKQLEETNLELKNINLRKDKFIRILAHDLKSPFNPILGLLENLLENIRSYDIAIVESRLSLIHRSAKSAFNLLEEILNWEMAQSGNTPFKPTELSFKDICLEAVESVELTAIKKNIMLELSTKDDINVFVDKNMLSTVLRNLVNNALKFTEVGGKIEIKWERINSNLMVSISDNGIGMSEEVFKKLFDISQMVSTRGTMNEKGTGLGLQLCKEFIERHEGKISIESEINVGTKVRFSLPIQKNRGSSKR